MNEIKPSMFNVEFEHEDANYVYNTRSGTLAQLEANLAVCLSDENLKDDLLKCGFIVDADMDEATNLLSEVDATINKKQTRLDITIVLTEACNFRCAYCYQTKNVKVFSNKDAKALIVDVEKLFDEGLETLFVHYFGGEPLLNTSMIYFLDSSFEKICTKWHKKYESYITTNGSLLTQEILEKIHFDTIQFTFDGDAKIHPKLKISDGFDYYDLLKKG